MKKEFNIIANFLEKNSKVLDVGCGDGELMKYINENITKDIRGLEISKSNVQKCIEKGLTVIEGDAEKDLKQFPEYPDLSTKGFNHAKVILCSFPSPVYLTICFLHGDICKFLSSFNFLVITCGLFRS